MLLNTELELTEKNMQHNITNNSSLTTPWKIHGCNKNITTGQIRLIRPNKLIKLSTF